MISHIRHNDPLTAIILAVLCNQQPDKTVKVSRQDFEKIPPGLQLRLRSDSTHAWVELVPEVPT